MYQLNSDVRVFRELNACLNEGVRLVLVQITSQIAVPNTCLSTNWGRAHAERNLFLIYYSILELNNMSKRFKYAVDNS